MNRESGTAGRVTEFDGLRGLLAWTVVICHLLLVSGEYDPLVRRFPALGEVPESAVDVFILLSGFAITHLLMLRPTMRSYFIRRACRIVPAYYVALFAGILLNGTLEANLRRLPSGSIGAGYIQICELGYRRLWLDAPLHVLLLHGLVPATLAPALPYTLLGVAWSLSLEFQFYAVAPAIFALYRHWRGTLVLVGTAVLISTLFASAIMTYFSSAFLLAKASFFFVGGLGYFALDERFSRAKAWVLCLLPGIALTSLWWQGTGRVLEAIVPSLVWSVIVVAIRFKRFKVLRASLNSRSLQFLGRCSYSTYLFHAPVVFILQAAIWRWASPSSTPVLLLWTTITGIPAILLVSWLAWKGIERPFQRLGRLYSATTPTALGFAK